MKKEVKSLLGWIVVAFTVGFMVYVGGQAAERVWPRQQIEFKESVNVYHHYDFNSVTQDWEER